MIAYAVKKHGNVEDIEKIEIKHPKTGKRDVLINVKAAAINPADLKVITGKDGGKFIHSSKSPIRLGFDFSGIIKEIGSEVTEFNSGDEVFGFLPYSGKNTQGSFAEYIVADEDEISIKPSSISHIETATAATAATTALKSLLDIGKISKGDKIFINGASGGVGSYAVQIAKSYKLEIWGTCSSDNLDYIKSIGVTHPLDYGNSDLNDLNEYFDLIFDVASNMSLGRYRKMLDTDGIYITLLPSLNLILGKIAGFFSKKRFALCIVKPKKNELKRVADMIEKRVIKPPVTATYSIKELPKALKRFSYGGVRGKIGIFVK